LRGRADGAYSPADQGRELELRAPETSIMNFDLLRKVLVATAVIAALSVAACHRPAEKVADSANPTDPAASSADAKTARDTEATASADAAAPTGPSTPAPPAAPAAK